MFEVTPFTDITFLLTPGTEPARLIRSGRAVSLILSSGSVHEARRALPGLAQKRDITRNGTYTLVLYEGGLTISIFSSIGNFHVSKGSDGTFRSSQNDPASPVNCGLTNRSFASFHRPLTPFRASPFTGAQEPTGNVEITVLFLFTTQALSEFNNDANALRAEIELGLRLTNESIKASDDDNIDLDKLTVTSVGIEPAAKAQVQQTGSFGYDLENITNSNSVLALRKSTKADVVSLIRGRGDMWGIAWGLEGLNPQYAQRGYNVVWSRKVADHLVFAHELGHNLGCAHNIENVDFAGLFNYSHGWHGSIGGGTTNTVHSGTIMSYPGQRLKNYSSPRKQVQGVQIGDAESMDNARTIHESMRTVSQFQQ